MNTIATSELETEAVELLPERSALWVWGSPVGISAVNGAFAVNYGHLGSAWANATQAIVVTQS